MSKTLVIFRDENNESYVSIWNWIQRFLHTISTRGKRLTAFIIEIDEIVIQIGNHHFFSYGLQFKQYIDLIGI